MSKRERENKKDDDLKSESYVLSFIVGLNDGLRDAFASYPR